MSLYPKDSIPSFLMSTSVSPTVSKLHLHSQILSPKPSSLPPLQHSPKVSLDNESLVKNQNYIKLTNKHSILRSFVRVDKEDASLRDESSLNRSFKRMNAALSLMRSPKYETEKQRSVILESMLPIKEVKIRSKCRSVDLAMGEWRVDENDRWAEKKGINSSKKSSKIFQSFLKDLFETLDEDKNDILTPDELILPLLSYGLSQDPEFIEKSLKQTLSVQCLRDIKIKKQTFLSLFSEDTRVDQILQFLEIHTKKSLFDTDTSQKTRKFSKLHHSETRVEDVVPRVFCTVDQYVTQVKQWWNDLTFNSKTSKKSSKIHKSLFMDFLTSKNLVSNKIEAFRLASATESMGMIFFEGFERIFLKAILKSALINLSEGLNNKKFAGSDSLALRLFRCQRKLMVSGLSVRKTLMSVQGKMALNAVCRYQDANEESSRMRSLREAKNILEQADKELEDRLGGYLYKINEDAEQFLDNWGNLKSKESTWEIREKLKKNLDRMD